MNRREFLATTGHAVGGAIFSKALPWQTSEFQTRHLVWIVNGSGSRKQDWYNNPQLSPNFDRLSREAFVYEDSHNDSVANHRRAWLETITGNPSPGVHPTPLHYVRQAFADEAVRYWFINPGDDQDVLPADTRPISLNTARIDDVLAAPVGDRARRTLEEFVDAMRKVKLSEVNLKHPPSSDEVFTNDVLGLEWVPRILKEFKPRIIICRLRAHDAGHGSGGAWRKQPGWFEYERVCRTTDEQVGKIVDFIKRDPYFSKTTALLIRPEFGRDDEINMYGELHHSEGYPQTMSSAEIWWGPDFRHGVCREIRNRVDVVPSITKLFNVDAVFATGRVHAEMFRLPVHS